MVNSQATIEKLKSERKRLGWTQEDAAKALGFSVRKYGQIEAGIIELRPWEAVGIFQLLKSAPVKSQIEVTA